jgi:LacI family transcriptional regulator
VVSDHYSGVRAAVEHLLSLGHRRIAVIVGQQIRPSRERSRALVETMTRHGEKGYEVVKGTMAVQHGEEATAYLLGQRNAPTAIIAGGNQLLVWALQAIGAREIVVGQDLSLVGCDQVPVTEHYSPQIAVVQRDMRELGRVGAEVLLAQMRGGTSPSTTVLPTRYIPRPSVAPPLSRRSAKGARSVTA